jgi:hypothetical protein
MGHWPVRIKEPILVSLKINFQVVFIDKGPYCEGTFIQFSGAGAAYFYVLCKWGLIFFSSVIDRLDLKYSRSNKTRYKISVEHFLRLRKKAGENS